MTEGLKTLTFCGVAAASCLLALVTWPATEPVKLDDEVGTALFADFDDPEKAASLRIVSYSDDLGDTESFQVAKKSGEWVVPSHSGYPADAEDQMRDVATSLIDLQILSVQDVGQSDHELYGVVQPDESGSQAGAKGVGTLIEIANESSKKLCELIVGKEVKDAPGQRYVRVPGRDRIYVVTIDPEKFSTKFDAWIEQDLLKLNTMDVEQLVLKDYSVEVGATLDGRLAVTDYSQRFELTASEDTADNKWTVDEFMENRGGELQSAKLAENEELDKERLDGLKNALDDLKIVDVEKKPAGLGADLKADKGFMSQDGVPSLIEKGFYPVPVENNKIDLWSSNGEVLVRTKDGVEYVLRFGRIASVEQDQEDAASLNRWLFVSARLNDEAFPAPELEDVPDAPSEDEASEESGEPSEDVEAVSEGEPGCGQEEDAADDDADEDDAADDDADEDDADEDDADEDDADEDDADEDDADEDDADEEDDDEQGDGEPQEDDSVESDVAETVEAEQPVDAAEDAADARDRLRSERDRIMKENQRKLDEYNEKLDKAKETVGELNFRFADWYYVISDDVYKKIHLSRSDVIKVSEETEVSDLQELRTLEEPLQRQ